MEHFVHGASTAEDSEPRPAHGDRPGRRPARLRLLLRAAQADRPAPGPPTRTELLEGTGSERGRHLREMLDELGPDLRQVRPAALHAAGRRPAGHRRRAPRPPGRRAPVPVRGGRARRSRKTSASRSSASSSSSTAKPLAAASIGQVHRAVLPNGHVRRGQGPAPRRARSRSRPTSACSTRPRASRRSASGRSTSWTPARSSTSSPARSARSSTTGSRARNARHFRRNFAGHPHVAVPRVYWTYTRARVLTLEFIEGVQLADIDEADYSLEERRALPR